MTKGVFLVEAGVVRFVSLNVARVVVVVSVLRGLVFTLKNVHFELLLLL